MIVYAFFFKSCYPHLISPAYTNRDGVVLRLIRISRRIEQYRKDPSLSKNQLSLIKTQEYKVAKLKIKQSLSNYENVFAFETENRDFLKLLNKYLSINVKKIYNNEFKDHELLLLQESLKNLAIQIYHGDFEAAKKEMKDTDSSPDPKNKFLDLVLSPTSGSHLITTILFGLLIFTILDAFPINNIQDVSTLITLLVSLFLTYTLYTKVQLRILKIFEFMPNLFEPVKLNEIS